MLYELLYPLRLDAHWLRWLNVLRYVPFRLIMGMLTAMFICFAIAPWFIKRMQRQKVGQSVRDDGPQSHFSKAGTPTMGGSLILFAVVMSTVLWSDLHNPFVWLVLAVTVGYGLIGFIDDYLKIKYSNSKGMPGRFKLLFQISLAGVIFAYLFFDPRLPPEWLGIRDRLAVPFVAFDKHPIVLPGWLYVGFATFVVVAMSNAVNLTDGLDGLAAGTSAIVLVALAGIAFIIGRNANDPGITDLMVVSGCVGGACLGFLWYNTFPADVFMGDTGSLGLGGAIAGMAVITRTEFVLLIIGGLFVIEALSVMAQVVSFKLFHRRVLLMAPLHHHFELKAWSETKIIVRFWIIAALFAGAGFAAYYATF